MPEVIVQRFVDAANARNVDAMAALVAVDAVFARFPEGQVVAQNREGIRAYYSGLRSRPAEFRVTISQRIVDGQFVIDQEHVTGMAAEPRQATWMYLVREGLIQRAWALDSKPTVAAAAGARLMMSKDTPMDAMRLQEFGRRYTTAWCSQNAASVATFFSEKGSLKINTGSPAVGRTAITAAAQGFMTAFPNLVVTMDSVSNDGDRAVYRWTLTGTNTGRGGSGKTVRISGYEEWTFAADGLIAESKGHFDETEYNRQLK
jgi:hypothetical protein